MIMSVGVFFYHYFFFFKQKTSYEVRISDWSSDVCSSDLPAVHLGDLLLALARLRFEHVDLRLELAPARAEQPLLVVGDDRRLVGDRGRELDLLPLLQLGPQARFGRLQGQVLRAGVLQVGLRAGLLDAPQIGSASCRVQ